MRLSKRIAAILTAAVMLLSFASCAKTGPENNNDPQSETLQVEKNGEVVRKEDR